jgi:hypothetical protein
MARQRANSAQTRLPHFRARLLAACRASLVCGPSEALLARCKSKLGWTPVSRRIGLRPDDSMRRRSVHGTDRRRERSQLIGNARAWRYSLHEHARGAPGRIESGKLRISEEKTAPRVSMLRSDDASMHSASRVPVLGVAHSVCRPGICARADGVRRPKHLCRRRRQANVGSAN